MGKIAVLYPNTQYIVPPPCWPPHRREADRKFAITCTPYTPQSIQSRIAAPQPTPDSPRGHSHPHSPWSCQALTPALLPLKVPCYAHLIGGEPGCPVGPTHLLLYSAKLCCQPCCLGVLPLPGLLKLRSLCIIHTSQICKHVLPSKAMLW
jgi:hypothetical protein